MEKEKKKYMKIPLFKQIILGDLQEVKQLINNQNDLFLTKSKTSNDTCVIVAARFKQNEILKFFVESGCNIEESNIDGKRALHESVASGCIKCTKILLDGNAKVDALKRGDWTPLMFACVKGHLDILELLVSYGANINLLNKDGWNGFMLACREGHIHILRYLLNLNPDTYMQKSNNGRTCLHTCAMHGQLSAVIFLLKECKIYIDSVDSCGTTPLMDALRFGHVDIAQYLIDATACLSVADKYGNMPIHVASQNGCVRAVDFLMKNYSVDIDQCSYGKNLTPLHYAAKEGHVELLMHLLDNGAIINSRDTNGRTPLHLAAASNKINTVKLLLNRPGIILDVDDVFGKKAKDYAMTHEMKSLFTSNDNTL